MTQPSFALLREPMLDDKGMVTPRWAKWLSDLQARTAFTIDLGGRIALDNVRLINNLPSARLAINSMSNYSNNATLDSSDNGINATIRLYGPAGIASTWHQVVGGVIGQELPAFTTHASYNTQYWIWWDGTTYHVDTDAIGSLKDGVIYAGTILTVSAGGGGGSSGGGGSKYGGGGSQR